jgi:hypothetical protein
MVGRLSRRIYIYGLDGDGWHTREFARLPLTICAKQSNCTLHPGYRHSQVSPIVSTLPLISPLRWPATKPPRPLASRIQESNRSHQIFSGFVTSIGVTYPPVWMLSAPPQLAPQSSAQNFQPTAELYLLALGSQIFMADLLPEGCS